MLFLGTVSEVKTSFLLRGFMSDLIPLYFAQDNLRHSECVPKPWRKYAQASFIINDLAFIIVLFVCLCFVVVP